MSLVAAAFVLEMMDEAQPHAPWKNTYPSTAMAIATESNAWPLYPGEDGPARTAAIMVGVAEMESHFDPKAKGDGVCLEYEVRPATMFGLGALYALKKPRCIKRGPPQSFCAFQVHQSNFTSLGVSEAEVLGSIETCTRSALRMMHASFNLCGGSPWTPFDLLNQYATGGGVCVRPLHDEGEHRMRRGMWLYNWKTAKDKRTASNAP